MKMLESTGYHAASKRLLGIELSAFETYTQAIDDFHDDPERSILLANRSRHAANIDCLMDHLATLGAEMDSATRANANFSKAVEGVSMTFGESAAMMALEAGEAATLKVCRQAMFDSEIPSTLKEDLRGRLIPRLEKNVAELEKARLQ